MNIIIRQTLVIAALLAPVHVFARETLHFTTFESPLAHTFKAVLALAYQRIGYDIEVQHLPGLRAIQRSNSGAVDGELYRVAGINQKYPNLIKIPVPIYELNFHAFTKNLDFKVNGWNSLAPYRVGFFRGTRFIEQVIQGKQVTDVKNYTQLFDLLDNRRLDVVIAARQSGQAHLSTFDNNGMRMLSPPIVTQALYHFIHNKNKRLLPALTKELTKMKIAGEFDRIAKQMQLKKPVIYSVN